MKIDYERIGKVFKDKAWAYAEQYDGVKIGRWNGNEFSFYEELKEDYLLLLRVFDKTRELKFTGDKCRDTDIYKDGKFIAELADAKYYLYGEKAEPAGDYTALSEKRGGKLFFPARLKFPNNRIALKLGIRHYVRYNRIKVLGMDKNEDKDKDFCDGLETSGAGPLEVVDFAYTGFFYDDKEGTEVD